MADIVCWLKRGITLTLTSSGRGMSSDGGASVVGEAPSGMCV